MFTARETVFWQNSEGFGTTTRVYLDRAISDTLLLRWANLGKYTEETLGLEWYTQLTLFQSLNERTGLAWQVQTEGETDNEVQLTRHSARLIVRRQLTADWLFLELRGGVSWPRRKLSEKREASPEVGIALEMEFGNRRASGRREPREPRRAGLRHSQQEPLLEKSMKSLRTVLLATSLLAVSGLASAADAPSSPMPAKAVTTQAAERDLWLGHIFWVREVARGLAEKNQAAADFAEKQVVANAKGIAGSIEPFYGKAATDAIVQAAGGSLHCDQGARDGDRRRRRRRREEGARRADEQCQRDCQVPRRREPESAGGDFEEPARRARWTSRAAEPAARRARLRRRGTHLGRDEDSHLHDLRRAGRRDRQAVPGQVHVNELDSMQHAAALAAADVVAAAGDDVSLASRAAQGDQAAFSRIMRRYNQRLYRLAVSVMGDASEAEDVLQESYVRAFYSFASYAGTGSLGAWLARIVRNEAIDRVRARESRRSHVAIEADLGVLSGEDDTNVGDDLTRAPSARFDLHSMTDPQALASNAELRRLLERAIQRLPEQFRTAFVLREVEGLSVEETAEYLGIPPATVKTRDHRARNLLRSYLSENIDATIPQTFPFLGARCDLIVEKVLLRLKM